MKRFFQTLMFGAVVMGMAPVSAAPSGPEQPPQGQAAATTQPTTTVKKSAKAPHPKSAAKAHAKTPKTVKAQRHSSAAPAVKPAPSTR